MKDYPVLIFEQLAKLSEISDQIAVYWHVIIRGIFRKRGILGVCMYMLVCVCVCVRVDVCV